LTRSSGPGLKQSLMQRFTAIVIIFTFALSLRAVASDETVLGGYSSTTSSVQHAWEDAFRAIPKPENLREYMRRLSAHPHHVGSAYDKDNADWILTRFNDWGFDAHIETFDVLFPTPKTRILEMLEPVAFRAKLDEPAIPEDPTSNQTAEQLPTYNAYSIDGDVSGPLVYVNYGAPKDYDELERFGISVKGAIVIVRYGQSFRGIKPKVAAAHGAVGCIIYSDPRDDGYFKGDVFPEGPMRNSGGVQRGSVMDFVSSSPGDPLSPGFGATPKAKPLPLNEAKSLSKIPTLPISYGDAQPLLTALKGPLAPEQWRGGLPITYHIGRGPAKVHLKLQSDWNRKKIYDVIAYIHGSEESQEWIIRGNHFDAWVNGASDPISGQIALLEEARSFGELLKQGWKPRRTIVYCAWDGEEPGLLGSTEWAEMHADELREHAAVYINSDDSGRGFLSMSGSHTLEHFVNGVARDIQDPETQLSIWKRRQLHDIVQSRSEEERDERRRRADLRIDALGSGSDYTAFLDHLGIASLQLSFEGEGDDDGSYHSIYDDFYWYTRFSDTSFVYGRALAQTIGTAVMRFADADVLPFEFTDFADTIQKYTRELQRMLTDKQDEIRERNRQLEEGVFQAMFDPRRPMVPPPRVEIPPFINFAPMQNAADALTRSAERYRNAMAHSVAELGDHKFARTLHDVNQELIQSERRLTTEGGLSGRSWYKHLLYAPGAYTGYTSATVPGVREAIDQMHFQEAELEIVRVARVLQDEARLIDAAANKLETLGQ
jgi:N-acetylated-alpha-linked acidic dipeptidase